MWLYSYSLVSLMLSPLNALVYIHISAPLHCPLYKQYPLQDRNDPEARAFEVSSSVSLSALNISSWADGAQMDSKEGMSLKIHGTHHDQGERRGAGIKH